MRPSYFIFIGHFKTGGGGGGGGGWKRGVSIPPPLRFSDIKYSNENRARARSTLGLMQIALGSQKKPPVLNTWPRIPMGK